MGCCGGDREKEAYLKNDVKWEYVNLNDFKSTSCFTPLAYIYLWIMLFVSISVYAVDTFTAINLLAFNRWAGQIQPEVPLKYTRWIFAGCIILSFVLLIYRWIRALKVMRGGKVAKAYLDPLAVRVECIRMGQEGRGWKRFLVFADLTKSRKGADYVALFAYFSFEAWLRIIFAEGPRVVINAMTLYAYAEANIVPKGDHDTPRGQSPFVQFWKNFGVLAEDDQLQMAIIIGMLWTCFIWLISALSLLVSVILYLIFLWHHIPSDAGGLSGYCRTKVNRRMERVIKVKTDKALKKENELRARQEAQAFRNGGGADFKRQPTLPDVAGGVATTATFPTLSRQTTTSTLPEYSSRPGTAPPSEQPVPPLPASTPLDPYQSKPGLKRHMTAASDASWSSYNSNAPLINNASDYGYAPDRMQTPVSNMGTPWSARPGGSNRNFSNMSNADRSFTPGASRPGTAHSQRGPPASYQMETISRPGTGMSQRSGPMRMSADSDSLPPMPRGPTPVLAYPQSATSVHAPPFPRGPTPGSAYPQSATSIQAPTLPDLSRMRTPANNNNPYFPPVSPIPESGGRESPAMPINGIARSYTPVGPPPRASPFGHAPPQPRLQTPAPASAGGYVPFNPSAGRTPSPPTHEPYRSFTQPQTGRSESPASLYSVEPYRSFTQPQTSRSQSPAPGHTGEQYRAFNPQSSSTNRAPAANSNLQPPHSDGPARAGSFDDILDHY